MCPGPQMDIKKKITRVSVCMTLKVRGYTGYRVRHMNYYSMVVVTAC